MIKKENGVTLVALAIYISMLLTVIALLSTIVNNMYPKMTSVNSESLGSEQFNKFNVYFVKDVKSNESATVTNEANGNVKIAFLDGTNYLYVKSESAIYRGKVKIAKNIKKLTAEPMLVNQKNAVNIMIETGDNSIDTFKVSIKYILKYW